MYCACTVFNDKKQESHSPWHSLSFLSLFVLFAGLSNLLFFSYVLCHSVSTLIFFFFVLICVVRVSLYEFLVV